MADYFVNDIDYYFEYLDINRAILQIVCFTSKVCLVIPKTNNVFGMHFNVCQTNKNAKL